MALLQYKFIVNYEEQQGQYLADSLRNVANIT